MIADNCNVHVHNKSVHLIYVDYSLPLSQHPLVGAVIAKQGIAKKGGHRLSGYIIVE